MNQKQLFYFTGKCLALDDHPGYDRFIQSRFVEGDINPEDFIWFGDKHFVLPAIYLKFKNYNLLNLFSQELKTHIAGIYLRNKQRNLEILKQADEISLVLKKKNIQPIYLKGTAHIMDNLYSDPGERLIGDIDLLVQEKDYILSAERLKQVGYDTRNPVYSDVTQSTHYPPLFKEGAPVHLEIHRLPVNPPYSKWFSTGSCFEHKNKIPGKTNCYVQSDEQQVIHNFIHSRLNNLGHGFYLATLRDLYDFYLLSELAGETEVRKLSKEHKKLDCYYALINRFFGSNFTSSETENKYVKQYFKRFDWYMMHPRQHHQRIFMVKLSELIFRRFFSLLGILLTFKFWSRTFRNPTKAGFYKMLVFRVRHFREHYIRF